jgi:hypothetical protein
MEAGSQQHQQSNLIGWGALLIILKGTAFNQGSVIPTHVQEANRRINWVKVKWLNWGKDGEMFTPPKHPIFFIFFLRKKNTQFHKSLVDVVKFVSSYFSVLSY